MIYTKLTKEAMKIAHSAHMEQFDKSGVPYIFHPAHLAEQMPDEETTCAALLHDVLEDTDITVSQLQIRGIPETVIEALNLLNHNDDRAYLEYVQELKNNRIAKSVKLADLKHNSNLSRLDTISDADIQRINKYRKAIEILLPASGVGSICGQYDVFLKTYRRTYQLESSGLYYLSEFIPDNDEPLYYSFDVEAANDSHYGFKEEQAKKLKSILDPAGQVSDLATALVTYFADHVECDLILLMNHHEIHYSSYHYD